MLHDCRGTIHTLVYVNCASVGLVWFSACAPIRDGLGRMYTIFIAEINGIQGRLLAERSILKGISSSLTYNFPSQKKVSCNMQTSLSCIQILPGMFCLVLLLLLFFKL